MLCVLDAMLFVLAVILLVAAFTLEVNAVISVVLAVMLLVFAFTRVSKAVILEVAELTVPLRLVMLLVAEFRFVVTAVIEAVVLLIWSIIPETVGTKLVYTSVIL